MKKLQLITKHKLRDPTRRKKGYYISEPRRRNQKNSVRPRVQRGGHEKLDTLI